LEEELAGLRRAQVCLNTEKAIKNEKKTVETLVQFIHDEGLLKLRSRSNKLAGAVFKAMDEPISEWENKINQ
jgi:hypothetical protein